MAAEGLTLGLEAWGRWSARKVTLVFFFQESRGHNNLLETKLGQSGVFPEAELPRVRTKNQVCH